MSGIICPKCGKENGPIRDDCWNCGEIFTEGIKSGNPPGSIHMKTVGNARNSTGGPMNSSVTIQPKITINETGINIYIKISDDNVAFPRKCSLCLSDDASVIRGVKGKKMITSLENELSRAFLGLLAPKSSRPLILVYKGQVPYCKDCAKKRVESVIITDFDKCQIHFEFVNPEYAKIFLEANNALVPHDVHETKGISHPQATAYKTCLKCHHSNPKNATVCEECGANLYNR